MKLLLLLGVVALAAYGTAQTCGGSCTSSVKCATDAGGDMNCRCSYLSCEYNANKCSGSCITNTQCADWAGDSACGCSWWFECEMPGALSNPGYKPFLKIARMAKLKAEERKALADQGVEIKFPEGYKKDALADLL